MGIAPTAIHLSCLHGVAEDETMGNARGKSVSAYILMMNLGYLHVGHAKNVYQDEQVPLVTE